MSRQPKLVIIVGGGPAGLATSRALQRRGVEHRVLERGPSVGTSWRHFYDSLVLHTGKHLSHLPGLRFDRRIPLFPTRNQFVDHLEAYSDGLPLELGRSVSRIVRLNHLWRVLTDAGELRAHAVVMATGIASNPRIPSLQGRGDYRGTVRHSVDYRQPDPFSGRKVLVVGAGNSAGEIASELALRGIDVSISIRSGANVVPRSLLGIPIQYLGVALRKLPAPLARAIAAGVRRAGEIRRGPSPIPRPPFGPLEQIPLIGFHLVESIREGRVKIKAAAEGFTPEGVRFADGTAEPFDDVILATGFAPALVPLGELVRTDAKGFARRRDRVVSLDQPNLFFTGHNYDSAGGLWNIRRDSALVADRIAHSLS